MNIKTNGMIMWESSQIYMCVGGSSSIYAIHGWDNNFDNMSMYGKLPNMSGEMSRPFHYHIVLCSNNNTQRTMRGGRTKNMPRDGYGLCRSVDGGVPSCI